MQNRWPWNHPAQWNRPDTKGKGSMGSIYMRCRVIKFTEKESRWLWPGAGRVTGNEYWVSIWGYDKAWGRQCPWLLNSVKAAGVNELYIWKSKCMLPICYYTKEKRCYQIPNYLFLHHLCPTVSKSYLQGICGTYQITMSLSSQSKLPSSA